MAFRRILGTLGIDYRANNAQFVRASNQNVKKLTEQQRALRRYRNQLKRMNYQLRQTLRRLISFRSALTLAAGGGGFGLLLRRQAQFGATLVETGRQLGINVERLQELRRVAEADGVAITELDNSIRQLSRRLGDAAAGNYEYAEVFERLGIALTNQAGETRDVYSVILDASDAINSLTNQADRAAAAYDLFGRQGIKLLPILQNGSQFILEQSEAFRRFGIVTQEEAEDLKALEQSFTDLNTVLRTSLAKAVAQSAASFQQLNDNLAETIPNLVQPFIESISRLAANLDKVAAAAKLFFAIVIGGRVVRGLDNSRKALIALAASTAATGKSFAAATIAARGFFSLLRGGVALGLGFAAIEGVSYAIRRLTRTELEQFVKQLEGANDLVNFLQTRIETLSQRQAAGFANATDIQELTNLRIELVKQQEAFKALGQQAVEVGLTLDEIPEHIRSYAHEFVAFQQIRELIEREVKASQDAIASLNSAIESAVDGVAGSFSDITNRLRQSIDSQRDDLALRAATTANERIVALAIPQFRQINQIVEAEQAAVLELEQKLADATSDATRKSLQRQLDIRRAAAEAAVEGEQLAKQTVILLLQEQEALNNRSEEQAEKTIQTARNFASSIRGFNLDDFIQAGERRIDQISQETQAITLQGGALAEQQARQEFQNRLLGEQTRLYNLVQAARRKLDQAIADGNAENIAAAQAEIQYIKQLQAEYREQLPAALKIAEDQARRTGEIIERQLRLENLADIARGIGEAFGDFTGSIIKNFDDIGDAARRLGQTIIDNLIRNLIATPISNAITGLLGGVIPGLQAGGLGRGLALVGEAGPEIVDFRNPGRVYSNQDLQAAIAGNGSGATTFNFAPVIQTSDSNAVRQALAEAYPVFQQQILNDIELNSRRPSSLRTSIRY